MQQPKRISGIHSVVKILQHWISPVLLSLIINVALLQLFVLILALGEPPATDKGRLNVLLVKNAPQEQMEPPQPKTERIKKRKPRKPKVIKNTQPKPVVKPPPPKKVVQAVKKPEPPPPEPDEPTLSMNTPVDPKPEEAIQEPATTSEATEELITTNPPVPLPAQTMNVVPLFRLTRMPKIVEHNLEALKRFYPQEERDLGKEGTVEAMILVDENGDIVDIKIIKSAGDRFDAAAKKALLSKLLVIQPGYIGDKPVASRVPIPLEFKLTD